MQNSEMQAKITGQKGMSSTSFQGHNFHFVDEGILERPV